MTSQENIQELYKTLKNNDNNGMWGLILKDQFKQIKKSTDQEFCLLIETLYSQCNDNEDGMIKVLGYDAVAYLKMHFGPKNKNKVNH